ncbi:unnamed protein product, partial [marine sediment metagenome]
MERRGVEKVVIDEPIKKLQSWDSMQQQKRELLFRKLHKLKKEKLKYALEAANAARKMAQAEIEAEITIDQLENPEIDFS